VEATRAGNWSRLHVTRASLGRVWFPDRTSDCALPLTPMSLITPTDRRGQRKPRGRGGAAGKGGNARHKNNIIYQYPLPLILEPPAPTRLNTLLGHLGLSQTRILNPQCKGFFDLATRSVWIVDSKDARILWQRGFFGKGDLSRSEPNWLARQINARKAGKKGGKAAVLAQLANREII
jgi:hypothetical protein